MTRQTQPLEPYVALHPDNNNSVRCLICDEVSGTSKWMTKKNIRDHSKTDTHNCNAKILEERRILIAQRKDAGAEEAGVTQKLINPTPLQPSQSQSFSLSQNNNYFASTHDWYFGETGAADQFTAGEDTFCQEEHMRLLREASLYSTSFYERNIEMSIEDNDATVTNVLSSLQNSGIFEESATVPQDIQDYLSVRSENSWYPYKNKTMFLLDMIDNLPRLRLSDSHLDTIIWVMKEAGCRDVPSLSTLRRVQASLKAKCSVETSQHTSAQGNIFYVNNVAAQLARDWANPLIRPFLNLYPEDNKGAMSETWHAEKFCRELLPEALSPMICWEGKHYYLKELSQCHDRQYVLPLRWIYREKVLCADVMHVHKQDSNLMLDPTSIHSLPIHQLKNTLPDILRRQSQYIFNDNGSGIHGLQLHPLRIKAQGRPIFMCYMNLWGDDVSGNKSKQWNVHWNWYFVHAGIPKKLLMQEYFVRFASTSPHASNVEQVQAIINQIKETQSTPIVTWDCETAEEVLLMIGVHILPADNPMQSELTSHIGLKGNCFCRKCNVGGSQDEKMEDEGYHMLFEPGLPRNVTATRMDLARQYQMASLGHSCQEIQRSTGIKDSIAEKHFTTLVARAKSMEVMFRDIQFLPSGQSVVDYIANEQKEWLNAQVNVLNPLLLVPGLDPHRDTPVEPLHTVLLGVVKYIWALTCSQIQAANRLNDLEVRLGSINTDGLQIPPLRAAYLVQYRGGLIGRQFKALMQTMIFILHDIVPPETFKVWQAAGRVGALLWFPEIDDTEEYLGTLKFEIGNLLDSMAALEPNRIIQKPKFHILTHIVEDIRRFGPSIIFSTEIFECYNAVFRMCSILSNHQAPSRDIASKFSDMERFKHTVSGGYWNESDKWCQAGSNVRLFFQHNPRLQGALGWMDQSLNKPGSITFESQEKLKLLAWNDTLASSAIPLYFDPSNLPTNSEERSFHECRTLRITSGDIVRQGSFVIYGHTEDEIFHMGRVAQIITHKHHALQLTFAILDRFYVGQQHAELEMPTLHRNIERTQDIVEARHLQLIINVQHDCARGNCQATGQRAEVQERKNTMRMIRFIQHSDESHYVLNLNALHNAHSIRRKFKFLPHLLASRPVATDRQAFHFTLASQLRQSKAINKHIAKEKREINKVKKKAQLALKSGSKVA